MEMPPGKDASSTSVKRGQLAAVAQLYIEREKRPCLSRSGVLAVKPVVSSHALGQYEELS